MGAPNAEPAVEIDVRPMSVEERRAALAQALELLREEQAVVLITDRHPKPILAAIDEKHRGEFHCIVIATTPGCFRARMELGRTPPPVNTMVEALQTDHARLNAMLVSVERHLRESAFDEAAAACSRFSSALLCHFAVEEELLFPAMHHMTEAVAQPVDRLLAEHGRLGRLTRDLASALVSRDAARASAAWNEARRQLAQHQQIEEKAVYPVTDWALSGDEQGNVIRRLRGG